MSKGQSLYELTGFAVDLEALITQFEERSLVTEGEGPQPTFEQELEILYDALIQNAQASEKKLERICHIIKNREATLKAKREEADRLLASAKTDENAVKRLKGLIKMHLEAQGMTKSPAGPLFTVAIQKNGGKAPLAILDPLLDQNDQEALGELERQQSPYVQTIYQLDRELIRKDIELGFPVEFAEIKEVGTHVRIR